MTDMAHAALAYARRNWPVFPLKPGTKQPNGLLAPNGCKSASTAPQRIAYWWTRSPLSGIGIACGAPGPSVVDFDVTAGKCGRSSYAKLAAAGLLAGAQLVVETPSGGRHLYFVGSDQGNGSLARHGVDFRGVGGYVVAPPTEGYTVLRTDTESASGIDFDAARRVLDPPRPVRTPRPPTGGNHDALVRHVARLAEGGRNAGLFWAACRAAEGGADEDVYRALVDAATAAGLPEREAVRTVESARRRVGVA